MAHSPSRPQTASLIAMHPPSLVRLHCPGAAVHSDEQEAESAWARRTARGLMHFTSEMQFRDSKPERCLRLRARDIALGVRFRCVCPFASRLGERFNSTLGAVMVKLPFALEILSSGVAEASSFFVFLTRPTHVALVCRVQRAGRET